ncbi:GNAT family N-acetyltransferase [Desulfonatronovibrio hydrogenovorans]|uniref:GNAT family N-acetyltransferase n=1 Tax=Desulfonatronovibrio hydrogenovorans TaxID=53245 RepID=UPI00049032CF|nr:GNAT family N-acetyltransferase [Desulfonatronovibrio hydrogenovorans]
MVENQSSCSRIKIREMGIDDLAPVFHIGEEVFTAEYSTTLYRTWDEYEITNLFNSESELCLVAEIDEHIVGFALGTTVDKTRSAWKYGYLIWLGVRKNLQHAGVGGRLFKEILRRMRAMGVRMIIVDTAADNKSAISFFQKQGFGDIQKHVFMSLNLSRKARSCKPRPARASKKRGRQG